MREIDYDLMLRNADEMINALEYDCQRSMGKCKFNASDLFYLYEMKKRCEEQLNKGAKAKDDSSTRKKAKAVAEG